ncbi:DUF4012 domain-containing protein [Pseudarthrobacter enclensis]|uniref:DUF4012 domain-containing protein n=1 Tax=Pseudarthrobacter enclensis TaxID=993070 RepID=UPI0036A586A2
MAAAAWLGVKASTVNDELQAAMQLVPVLKEHAALDNPVDAAEVAADIREHTVAAKNAVADPVWTLASSIPWAGANFSAVTEIARSADDVASLGLKPLVSAYKSLDWNKLVPNATESDLGPLEAASPTVASAAYAVKTSAQRLNQIDETALLPSVRDPLQRARGQLNEVSGTLSAAADASRIAPAMMGAAEPRSYLLMIQNNAEARSSGGIPGALAVVYFDKGRLSLGAQSSASELGTMDPVVAVDPVQQQIYSSRLGKFMQDVNLTPDFPTAAKSAQAMWERKTGQHVDGVISIDPVVLSYILQATGPVTIKDDSKEPVNTFGLPSKLSGDNVVQTLLSDVYAKVPQPKLQDRYFSAVAREVFAALSEGGGDAKNLLGGITRGAEEGRVLIWSGVEAEQSTLVRYAVGGSVAGANISPAEFGVYFNDGTGAKMDYYIKRNVQLIRKCPKDGYEETTVRVVSTNTAPRDAAKSLPSYVTGDGNFGVSPGSVQTNIVVYGPAQANVETVSTNGAQTPFAPYLHDNRPVGVIAQQLAPGETSTVDFNFGKIVQHTEPNLVVTPSVQPVNEVKLPTTIASCPQ